MNFPETAKKITLSVGLIITLFSSGIYVGITWQKNTALQESVESYKKYVDSQIQAVKEDYKERFRSQEKEMKTLEDYLNGEDDGVRSDFEKEDRHIWEAIGDLKKDK